jgi:hypothetical protein
LANAILQHRTEDEHAEEAKSSLMLFSRGNPGKRKRVQSQSVPDSKLLARLRSAAGVDLTGSGSAGLAGCSSVTVPKVVLRSAFRPPTRPQFPSQPKWMRNPPMTQYSFTYVNAKFDSSGSVVFTSSTEPASENIEIAKDWKEGERLYNQGKSHETTGFIGKGYTKRAIYVCFNYFKFERNTS